MKCRIVERTDEWGRTYCTAEYRAAPFCWLFINGDVTRYPDIAAAKVDLRKWIAAYKADRERTSGPKVVFEMEVE